MCGNKTRDVDPLERSRGVSLTQGAVVWLWVKDDYPQSSPGTSGLAGALRTTEWVRHERGWKGKGETSICR